MATATASAPAQTSYRKLYIDGQWVDATGGKRLAVINPATEETIAEVAFGTREDCKKAIAAAKAAMPGWAKQTPRPAPDAVRKTASAPVMIRSSSPGPHSGCRLERRSSTRNCRGMPRP